MLLHIRYNRGRNGFVYVRCRNAAGQFWNFVSRTWGTVESAAGNNATLSERPDSDPLEALYAADVIPPTVPCLFEYLDSADPAVLGTDTYRPDPRAVVANAVRVDHNYGSPGALRLQAPNGAAIDGAEIRVFRQSELQQGSAVPVAVSRTNARGEWVDAVYLEAGYTYVVQFQKAGLSGPDHVQVVV